MLLIPNMVLPFWCWCYLFILLHNCVGNQASTVRARIIIRRESADTAVLYGLWQDTGSFALSPATTAASTHSKWPVMLAKRDLVSRASGTAEIVILRTRSYSQISLNTWDQKMSRWSYSTAACRKVWSNLRRWTCWTTWTNMESFLRPTFNRWLNCWRTHTEATSWTITCTDTDGSMVRQNTMSWIRT